MSHQYIEIVPTNGKFHVVMNGVTIHKAGTQTAAQHTVDKNMKGNPALVQMGLGASEIHIGEGGAPVEEFDINERFQFLEAMSTMVASGDSNAMIVTGPGGLGKTFTVQVGVEAAGLKDRDEAIAKAEIGASVPLEGTYTKITGYSSAKAMYRLLYDLNGSLIIFDDCDSIQKDQNALNVLKGALASHGKRMISWHIETDPDDDLPNSFEFTGQIIFISNKSMSVWDGAVRSRCLTVDVHMTRAQIVERMRGIVERDSFMPEYDIETKRAALQVIDENKDRVKDLNLRTLNKAVQVLAKAPPAMAASMVKYAITN